MTNIITMEMLARRQVNHPFTISQDREFTVERLLSPLCSHFSMLCGKL